MDIQKVYESVGIELKASGSRWKALCPFHPEVAPSFWVYPDGSYHCFGCQAHGTLESIVNGQDSEFKILPGLSSVQEDQFVRFDLMKRKYEAELKIEAEGLPIQKLFSIYDKLDQLFLHVKSLSNSKTTLDKLVILDREYTRLLDFIKRQKSAVDL